MSASRSDPKVDIEIPPIISVDDHLIEPPDLWQRWLPAKWREVGPRVVSGPWEMVPEEITGRAYRSGWSAFRVALDAPATDWWVYEDHRSGTLIGNAAAGLPPGSVKPGPIRFSDMRPGCFQVKERLQDMDLNHVERSLCFPTFAALLRSNLSRRARQRGCLSVRSGIQRLHGRGMGGGVWWATDSSLPCSTLGCRARGSRGAPKR